MALADRLQDLLDRGEVTNYSELARVGHVTRARVTQVMNSAPLAPDTREQILHLPPAAAGRDRLKGWEVRPVAAEPLWADQRKLWRGLTGGGGGR
jgi:hypothetical protein